MSKGFAGLCRGLALVDGQPGARYGIKGRLVGLLLGLATLLVMTIVLLQIVVGPLLGFEKLLPGTSMLLTVWNVVRWPVLVVLVVVWLTTLLHIGPGPDARRAVAGPPPRRPVHGGGVGGRHVRVQALRDRSSAAPTRSSACWARAIVSLTWLYLLAMTTLLGAELNAVLADRRAPVAEVARRRRSPSPARARAGAPAPSAVGAGAPCRRRRPRPRRPLTGASSG